MLDSYRGLQENKHDSFICTPFLLPPYNDTNFKNLVQDVVALRTDTSVRPAEILCVGQGERMGVRGCTIDVVHQDALNTLGVKQIFLNPQSHPHREVAKAIALYTGVMEAPYLLCRNKNDVQHLSEASKSYGNVAVYPDAVKLSCYGEGYRAKTPEELVKARYELSGRNIIPRIFRNSHGERSAPNLTQ